MKARTIEQPYDQEVLAEDMRTGIDDVVRKQVETGIDIPNDGEFAAHGFVELHPRAHGRPGAPPADPDEDIVAPVADREQQVFPEFFEQYHDHFRYLWMPPRSRSTRYPTARATSSGSAWSARSSTSARRPLKRTSTT